MAITTDSAQLRLLQLASMSLPVGGFAFSQGMEYATENGWLKNSQDVNDWLQAQLQQSFARVDLPIVFRLYDALAQLKTDKQASSSTPREMPSQSQSEMKTVAYWNSYLLACRETQELRLSDCAMGMALRRLLPTFGVAMPIKASDEPSFVTLFTAAAYHWQISPHNCALGLAWTWLENQIAAATKLVPLGQTQAQYLLGQLQNDIPAAIEFAHTLADEELGASLPALAIASALHESQYSRLFRS